MVEWTITKDRQAGPGRPWLVSFTSVALLPCISDASPATWGSATPPVGQAWGLKETAPESRYKSVLQTVEHSKALRQWPV